MKKTLALILAVLLLCLALLPACTPANADGIDTEIKKAYFDKHKEEYERSNERLKEYAPDAKPYTYEDIELERIHKIDDVYALFIDDGLSEYAASLHSETIFGYEFKYRVIRTIDIYQNGNFYTIQEAVDAGVLSETDVGELHAAYKEYDPALYIAEIEE